MATIPYKVVKRTVFSKNEKKVIYTPKISSTGIVSTKSLASQIAVESTISDNEAERFITAFSLVVKEALLNGFTVKLEKLGRFEITFKAKACEEADEVSADTIEKCKLVFTPSVTVEKKLAEAKFRKINLDLRHVEKE